VDDAAERNIISGNVLAGVLISGQGTNDNAVAGNFIGTDVSGTVDLVNTADLDSGDALYGVGSGVYIGGGASNNRIGTDGASVDDVGERNIIDFIKLVGKGTDGNIIAGNFVGTDVTGTRSLLSKTSSRIGIQLVEGPSSNWIGVNPKG